MNTFISSMFDNVVRWAVGGRHKPASLITPFDTSSNPAVRGAEEQHELFRTLVTHGLGWEVKSARAKRAKEVRGAVSTA